MFSHQGFFDDDDDGFFKNAFNDDFGFGNIGGFGKGFGNDFS